MKDANDDMPNFLILSLQTDHIIPVIKQEEEIKRYSTDRIEIVESGGIDLKSALHTKDPFPNLKCEKKKCLICPSEKSNQLQFECNSNNVGYMLGCDTCLERGQVRVYEGESSRSARIRGAEHLYHLRKNNPGSAFYKHKENEHRNEEMKISMKITKKFRDPLTRQANEVVRIENRNKNELLNSKTEFNHPPIARIVVEKRKFEKRKTGCDMKATKPCN